MNNQKYSNLIQINAESIGIKTLDNEIIDYLNTEIEEKIRLILQQAKKFMRISKRKTLKVDDLNNSIRFYNFIPLIGYDSYATSEYEKIENVKGLWRPKQNIVDIEEYLSKPLTAFPMKPFPHFHWFAIEGKKPNISENFIREEIKDINAYHLSIKNTKNKILQSIEQQQIQQQEKILNEQIMQSYNIANNINNNENEKKNLIKPVIHNISKELQIFFENFKQRFRKEIKMNKLNISNPYLKITKELEVSMQVLKTSPGVVELLPYIIEFLMNYLENSTDPKIYMAILYYIYCIIENKYFFIEPYLHQILILILSLILMENENLNFLDSIIKVKIFSIRILKQLIKEYEVKYNNLPFQLFELFFNNISTLEKKNLSIFGAIQSIIMLGPIFINKLIKSNKGKEIENYVKEIENDQEIIDNIKNLFVKNDYIPEIKASNLKEEQISNIDIFYKNDIDKRKKLLIYFTYALAFTLISDIQ